jgi:hypothetical protein
MKYVMKKLMVAMTLMVMLVAMGCGNGKKAAAVATLLTNGTGQNYVVVKADTNYKGWSVFKNVDTGEYVAYKVSGYDERIHTSLQAYLNSLGPDDIVHDLAPIAHSEWIDGYWEIERYTDSNGYEHETRTWHEGHWHNWTTYDRGGFSFELKRVASKDLEGMAAAASQVDADAVRGALVAQYGFSQDRAAKVATLTRQMSQIAGSRELTDADKTLFTEQALGVQYKDLKAAVKKANEGQKASFEQLLDKAAGANGTSPEATRQLILDMSGEAE